jgi:ATP-dependent helicase/nuclease subunit B
MKRGIFGLPPGVDFPRLLVQGLLDRTDGADPAAMARVTLFLNTRRMRRAVERHLTAQGARFLPRIRLVSDIGLDPTAPDVPLAVPALRRKLELTQLISALLEREPTLAPQAAVFDLADSLAALMDEMQGEAVLPAAIAAIDVSRHSAHWQRTQDFIGIITRFFAADAQPDPQARQRMMTDRLLARWQLNPPSDPVIIAGSTGSRGTTRALMQAVTALPHGVLVLPGYDFDLPDHVWTALEDARTGEDHPQFRFARLRARAADDGGVQPWVGGGPPNPARNRLISLSLRPAPVTDQWLTDGTAMQDLPQATEGMTLIVAPGLRAEAMAIALVLRRAVAEGRQAALISPDRHLTRRVTAILDGWSILPDDSAGEPLSQTATGRFLLMVAGIGLRRMMGEHLLALLKHPAVARGKDHGDDPRDDRGAHLRLSQMLESDIRKRGVAFPDAAYLTSWADGQPMPEAAAWARWLAKVIGSCDIHAPDRSLTAHLADLVVMAETLAKGPANAETGTLWTTSDGAACHAALQALQEAADAAGAVSARQARDILRSVLQSAELRPPEQNDERVTIWGPREARIQGADLVVLGGLNDGVWPALPGADPWLNRDMRLQAGLLLPERQVGLAAHDYQQAVCAAEVVLTRARRDAQAETVPSRWLNRLTNLLHGLPDNGGRAALAAMTARGDAWLALADAADDAPRLPPAPRPAPRPPLRHRPTQLSVTAIARLNRDPYAIYARYILGLQPIPSLRPGPDPLLRGQTLHRILESFARTRAGKTDLRAHLMSVCDAVLAEDVVWPSTRALWRARLDRAADFFLSVDAGLGGQTVLLESKAGIDLDALAFRLTAKPDRIDLLPDGRLRVLDYKTGQLPTAKQQKQFDNQLLLEACMAERGAFGPDLHAEVASATYIGLGSKLGVVDLETDPVVLARVWDDLCRVLARYATVDQGYVARRAMLLEKDVSDYDHLSRFGEWTMADRALPELVGDDDP